MILRTLKGLRINNLGMPKFIYVHDVVGNSDIASASADHDIASV